MWNNRFRVKFTIEEVFPFVLKSGKEEQRREPVREGRKRKRLLITSQREDT